MASSSSNADSTPQLPEYVPVPETAFGPALNEQGYYVGRVERNLFWVTDGTYQSAFLATPDGVRAGGGVETATGGAAAARRHSALIAGISSSRIT